MTENGGSKCCGPGYASPAEAMKAPREKLLYTVALYTGTGMQKPDYLATSTSTRQSDLLQVVHRLEMPSIGDELHHFGWNACSSCHRRRHEGAAVPDRAGLRAAELHIIDTRPTRGQPRAAQGDRGRGDHRQDQADGAAHRALPGHARS